MAIGDLNNDRHSDVVAWPYWYEGPGHTKRHVLATITKVFALKLADGAATGPEGF